MIETKKTTEGKDSKENALLVLVKIKSKKDTLNIEEEIEELKNLAISAGANIEGCIVHKQSEPTPKYFLSTGKLEEIKRLVNESQIDLVIFDEDLTSAQQSNLQEKLNAKVIDRTALILDIFSQRARSREGKLQVELAQLNYILPRLRGKGTQLSRLGGGIGTRGPGEQKLEVDRRKIRKRISQLEEKLKQISIQRDIQRKNREESNVFLISLIGYTNSGKSTLLNSITESDVIVRDMLFSTLDSTTRKMHIPETEEILMTDTVGFIEKLPHQLVASFKSTLEEVKKADLLLLVVDCSNPNYSNHIKSVMSVLKEIEVLNKQTLLVFNKIDKLENKQLKTLSIKYKNVTFISALYKIGLEDLYLKIIEIREKQLMKITVRIPYNESKLISFIYNNCKIVEKKYLEDSIVMLLIIDPKYCSQFAEFIFKDKKIESEIRGT
ncbi:MAG: GTPase HflX [Actinobacteria bacterium]|nr:GTPase HflX [Actinomycetota bacterium]